MLKVGVDAWNLPGDHRGIGRYLRSVLHAWSQQQLAVDVTLVIPEWHTWISRNRYRRETDGAYPVVSRHFVDRAGLDALWFPFNGCSWTRFAVPAVATLCDASNFVVPGYAPQTQRNFFTAAQRCRALITLSKFSQAELARELHVPPERIAVIPLGVAPPLPPQRVPSVEALGAFVLFVGTMERRKGIDILAQAMAIVQRSRPDLTLVVAGEANAKSVEGIAVRMRILGFVDDRTLAALYRACKLFAFPSRYEGFGLPILEAMSYGAPVISSTSSALPEAGGDAALYVPPEDPAALAAAIGRVVTQPDLADELRARGRARAAGMTWEKTARATLDVLKGVAA